jgi:NAD(P)-dependent dehydrogenase (short-subunit alcohol dehydrogenase family)
MADNQAGASSGIGLATATLLLKVGASVVAGDLNPVPIENDQLVFLKTDVTSWESLSALFELAEASYGKVDHVFANAGISGHPSFLEDRTDQNGKPLEPDLRVIDINLRGVIYTTSLALHYIKKHNRGSIVLAASASSFQRFRLADYSTY